MARLILSMDGLVLKEFTLTKERTTVGRKPHNDIQIDNLAVSGEHAVIVTILNDSFLEDLGSTNGTLVNGQPIKKHFLQNNDVIDLGKYKLKYVNETTGSTGRQVDFEKTVVIRPGGVPRPESPMALSQPMSALAVSQPQSPLPSAWVGANTSQPIQTPVSVSQPLAVSAHAGNGSSTMPPSSRAALASGFQPAMASDAGGVAVSQPLSPLGAVADRPSMPVAPVVPPQPSPAVSVRTPTGGQTIPPGSRARASSGPQPYTATRANPVYTGNVSADVDTMNDPEAASRVRLGAIQILTGSNAGRELELVKPLTTLGKPQVQVAVITKRPNGYFITHVEGATYPVLNGNTLDGQAHALSDHDIIEIAGVKMEFYLK